MPVPPKQLSPKPAPGPIELSLAGLSDAAVARRKAEIMGGLKAGSFTFTRAGITISASNWRFDPTTGAFEVRIAARDASGSLGVNDLYRFVNPPMKVLDGTVREELVDGELTEIPNAVERPLEAAQDIIYGAVMGEVERRKR